MRLTSYTYMFTIYLNTSLHFNPVFYSIYIVILYLTSRTFVLSFHLLYPPLQSSACVVFPDSNGHYLYVAGRDASKNATFASVISGPIVLTNATGFSFWYVMNGFGTGTLALYRNHGNESGHSSETLWSKSGRQGGTWLQGSVTLAPGNFTLRFEATVVLPISSDVAIDDIHLQTESYGSV